MPMGAELHQPQSVTELSEVCSPAPTRRVVCVAVIMLLLFKDVTHKRCYKKPQLLLHYLQVHCLLQGFLSLREPYNHFGGVVKGFMGSTPRISDSVGAWRSCLSKEFPGDPDAVGQGLSRKMCQTLESGTALLPS